MIEQGFSNNKKNAQKYKKCTKIQKKKNIFRFPEKLLLISEMSDKELDSENGILLDNTRLALVIPFPIKSLGDNVACLINKTLTSLSQLFPVF